MTSAIYANAEHSLVTLTYADGTSATVAPDYPGPFRQPELSVAAVLAELGIPEPLPYVEPPTVEAPLALQQIACARLGVDGWDVTGVARSIGIAGGFTFDDTLYAFLTEEQPDTDYIVIPSEHVTKFTDHIEITRPGLVSVSFIIQRVQ